MTDQQPEWSSHPAYEPAVASLRTALPLVSRDEVEQLSEAMTVVAAGSAVLLQAGDCAENLRHRTAAHVRTKLATLAELGDKLAAITGRQAIRVGRIGGQFAKPRSKAISRHGGRELPVFRGHIVNSELPTARARRPDPWRMVRVYEASAQTMRWLGKERVGPQGPWSSHEALLLDYERPLLRFENAGGRWLASTHLPWIGERTRDPAGAHVRLLCGVQNPIGCKIGPDADPDQVARLCERLNPEGIPGRLTLIVRMGKDRIARSLPGILDRLADLPVVWSSDPMHGNTVRTADGTKTRYVEDIVAEAVTFAEVLASAGKPVGGLHLEVAAEHVTECLQDRNAAESGLRAHYTSLCDPRLSPVQALQVIERWTPAAATAAPAGAVARS